MKGSLERLTLLIVLMQSSMSCQSLTKLGGLHFDQKATDAAIDANVVADAAPRRDAGPTCRIANGAQCNLVEQCGCNVGQHCQARGDDRLATCVTPGHLAQWSACSASADCPTGQTCDRGSCRSYCASDADCDMGSCYPMASADGRPDADLKVCWKQCQMGSDSACANGTTCRVAETPYATRASFCVARFDPCPTVEDGVCDEASGTGTCAAGTDIKDCGCKPTLSKASCDPIQQCGCESGMTCSAVPVDDTTYTTRCEGSGLKPLYSTCQATTECEPGLVCDDDLQICVNQCSADDQCKDGACRILKPHDINAIGHCTPTCDRRTNKPCASGSVCASFDERYDYGFSKPGDYCWKPLQQDCPTNNNCDEPTGTGICVAHRDEVDCCHPPSQTGECDPVEQCGCSGKPDAPQCRHVNESLQTVCGAKGSKEPFDLCSIDDQNCPPGYACGLGVCRPYCTIPDDCGSAGNLCIDFAGTDGGALGIGTCYMACEFTQANVCPKSLVCARTNPNVALCWAPVNCQPPYTNNGVCDDQRPGGTRICANGTDEADCASMAVDGGTG